MKISRIGRRTHKVESDTLSIHDEESLELLRKFGAQEIDRRLRGGRISAQTSVPTGVVISRWVGKAAIIFLVFGTLSWGIGEVIISQHKRSQFYSEVSFFVDDLYSRGDELEIAEVPSLVGLEGSDFVDRLYELGRN